jgi:hypothetical protein
MISVGGPCQSGSNVFAICGTLAQQSNRLRIKKVESCYVSIKISAIVSLSMECSLLRQGCRLR